MTTKVIITSPTPNHKDVLVTATNPLDHDNVLSTHHLEEGDSVTLYVHSTSEITITEVDKVAK